MCPIRLFLAGLISLIAVDLTWIAYFMGWFYRQEFGSLARVASGGMAPLWLPALITWALLVLGAELFVLPRVAAVSWPHTFLWGALFGFIVYGVYDFTNYATLKDWTLKLTLVDLAWGTFLNGLLACWLKFLDKTF